MSDHWEQFPCTMGDHGAFVSFDYGIREELVSLPFTNFACFKVDLLAPDDRGLPQGEEFAQLNEIEDHLCARLAPANGAQVGRVTTNGYRIFLFYTSLSRPDCGTVAQEGSAFHGHKIALRHESDPLHRGYWDELFPSEDDWQVIRDLRVQRSLEEAGDLLRTPRPIEHWAYFSSEAGRLAFVERVKQAFDAIDLYESPDAKGGRFTARLMHTGQPDYRSMNARTLLLSRAARENGGEYDGWETMVCKA